ncbi:MAG: sulfite exporter TauE/SafE family protein [Promethearchaeota archaeon]
MNFWLIFALLFLFGMFIGVIATIGGIGGGPIVMPLFLLIFQITPEIAKGTSIFIIFISTGIATITHYRAGKIHLPSLLIIAAVGSAGSITYFLIYPWLNISLNIFYLLFGIFELFIASRYIWKEFRLLSSHKFKRRKNELKCASSSTSASSSSSLSFSIISPDLCIDKNSISQNANLKDHLRLFSSKSKNRNILTTPFFFLAGFASSFLGIGGGPINTPVLYEIIKLPIYNATAASTTIIFFNSMINVILYALHGEINWIFALWMGGGMMIGSFIGAKFASKIPRTWILLSLSVLMAFAGLKLIFSEI